MQRVCGHFCPEAKTWRTAIVYYHIKTSQTHAVTMTTWLAWRVNYNKTWRRYSKLSSVTKTKTFFLGIPFQLVQQHKCYIETNPERDFSLIMNYLLTFWALYLVDTLGKDYVSKVSTFTLLIRFQFKLHVFGAAKSAFGFVFGNEEVTKRKSKKYLASF